MKSWSKTATRHLEHMSAAEEGGPDHKARATLLKSMAEMIGCTAHLEFTLPDGSRPDVVAAAIGRRILFLGEAKDTESPGCQPTQARLSNYLRWMAAHLYRDEAIALFAICFGCTRHTSAWLTVIARLAAREGICPLRRGVTQFDRGLSAVWITAAGPVGIGQTRLALPRLFRDG